MTYKIGEHVMNEYITAHAASKLFGHRTYKNLLLWIRQHGLNPDATLREVNGNITKLYKLESLQNLVKVHEADLIRRGTSTGLPPRGFTYTQLGDE